jgi:ABC-type multidrug transport system, ATPase component
MSYAVEAENLTKYFGNLIAVDSVSFKVKKGEIFGLVGPNGAGKSTLIRMICTVLRPSAGKALVEGYDIIRQPQEVRKL